jgi:hypothetical protein
MQNKFEQVLIRENVFLNNLNFNTLNNQNLPLTTSASASGKNNYFSGSNNLFYHNKINSNMDIVNSIDKSKVFNNNKEDLKIKIEDEKIKKNINEQLDYVINTYYLIK